MAKEYIDKDKLLNDIECIDISCCTDIDDIFTEVERTIDEQPTADVQELRHGKWIPIHYDSGLFDGDNCDKCSVCGYERFIEDVEYKTVYNYCPNCGAKMDKESEKNESKNTCIKTNEKEH